MAGDYMVDVGWEGMCDRMARMISCGTCGNLRLIEAMVLSAIDAE